MAYDAWTEGYLKAKQSKANKFDPNISIRFERVGNWIVSAKVLGGSGSRLIARLRSYE